MGGEFGEISEEARKEAEKMEQNKKEGAEARYSRNKEYGSEQEKYKAKLDRYLDEKAQGQFENMSSEAFVKYMKEEYRNNPGFSLHPLLLEDKPEVREFNKIARKDGLIKELGEQANRLVSLKKYLIDQGESDGKNFEVFGTDQWFLGPDWLEEEDKLRAEGKTDEEILKFQIEKIADSSIDFETTPHEERDVKFKEKYQEYSEKTYQRLKESSK